MTDQVSAGTGDAGDAGDDAVKMDAKDAMKHLLSNLISWTDEKKDLTEISADEWAVVINILLNLTSFDEKILIEYIENEFIPEQRIPRHAKLLIAESMLYRIQVVCVLCTRNLDSRHWFKAVTDWESFFDANKELFARADIFELVKHWIRSDELDKCFAHTYYTLAARPRRLEHLKNNPLNSALLTMETFFADTLRKIKEVNLNILRDTEERTVQAASHIQRLKKKMDFMEKVPVASTQLQGPLERFRFIHLRR